MRAKRGCGRRTLSKRPSVALETQNNLELLWYPTGESLPDEPTDRLLDVVRRRVSNASWLMVSLVYDKRPSLRNGWCASGGVVA